MRNNTISPRSRKSSSSSSSSAMDIEQGNNHPRSSPIRNLDPPSYDPPASSNNNSTTNTTFSSLIPTILKDTIIGVSLGVLFLLFLFFLDYRNIISIGSTKAFQSTGVKLLNDPDVISTLESSLNIKLLPLDTYAAMTYEIASNNQLMMENSHLQDYTTELSQLLIEQQTIQTELQQLTTQANTKLGLNKWCGECSGGWGNCNGRVNFLKEKYGLGLVAAKIDIMKQGNCIQK